MTGNDYNVALLVFFVPYILFEIPSNIILKKVAPSTWLSLIMVLWGIATMGQGLINNFGGLVAMRVLVGLFEAGLFPGMLIAVSTLAFPLTDPNVRLCVYAGNVLQAVRATVEAFTVFLRQYSGRRLWRCKDGGIFPATKKPFSNTILQLLAFALAKMDGVGGYGGWRW